MSMRAYESEQRISFRPRPETYYGFHVSGTATSDEIHPFRTQAERAAFVETVASGLTLSDKDERLIVAALAALAVYGTDAQAEGGDCALHDYYPAERKGAIARAEGFVNRDE